MKRFLLFLFAVLTGLTSFATDYKLVTDVSQLEVGANYLVVAPYAKEKKYFALGAKNGTNRNGVEVTTTENVITISNEAVSPLTLVAVEGDSDFPYALKDGDAGYLYNSDAKKLNLADDLSSKYTHSSISINESTSIAQITYPAQSDKKNYRLQFNYNNGSTRFTCYAGTMIDGYLYK